mmetsp:Transcript_121621/g.295150  ORF Transcript_121621/g.295150 Transcript_121621/m.295150 type:complete len:96 (+) Transcript_121621:3-290(+)
MLSPDALRVVEQRMALEPEMLRFTHYREKGFKPGKVRPGGPKSRTKRFHGVVRLDSPMFDADRFRPIEVPAEADATTVGATGEAAGGAGGDAAAR